MSKTDDLAYLFDPYGAQNAAAISGARSGNKGSPIDRHKGLIATASGHTSGSQISTSGTYSSDANMNGYHASKSLQGNN